MKKLITILEDDRDIREICTYVFESEGYAVNSYETIAELNKAVEPSNLFLLDIQLPDGNGLEVCENLKSSKLHADTPIVIMSANSLAAKSINQSRADDFIAKPFDIDQLVERVALLMS